jgi:hypothetical protein
VANSYLKAEKISATAIGLLQREIVLPALVWTNAAGSFKGAAGDTITMRVPARTQARSRTLRGARGTASEGNGIIQMDELTEHSVDVVLDEAIYSAIPTTDEELTLDISDFAAQILAPQVRAVAEGLENKLADEMVNATYAQTVTIPRALLAGSASTYASTDTYDVFRGLARVRKLMNTANIPQNDRIIVVGADMEEAFLNDPHLNRFDGSGDSGPGSALRDATLGRIAGFNQVVVSNALPASFGVAFHRSAFVLNLQAPAVPTGVPFGSSQSYQGLAMRYLRDYDFRNVQDRGLVDLYAGTNIIADGVVSEVQTLTPSGTISGGTFTLTARGYTTAALPFNATAAAIAAALNALPGVFCTATGGPISTTAVVVTFTDSGDMAQMTLTSSLTGTSPAVAVSTTTSGAPTFVRAIKLALAS